MLKNTACNPQVSVCVVTYNQVNFIGKCLDSLVSQITDFDFEIIVGDDCSTDGTTEVVKSYADRYSAIIKLVIHKNNIGAQENYLFIHSLAKGKYISHMDGDDYALPDKLSSQKKFLDQNNECSMVFHRCLTLQSNGDISSSVNIKKIIEPCDFASFLYLYPSCSWHSAKMYRKSADLVRKYLSKKNLLDKHLHFEHGLTGLVGFINQDLAVYRVGVGISSNIYWTQELALDSYIYAIELGYNKKIIKKIIAREHFEQGLRALEFNDLDAFQRNVKIGFESGHKTINSLLAYIFRANPEFYIAVRHRIRWLRYKVI